jgi:multiple sugar transport system substrate-binding protein
MRVTAILLAAALALSLFIGCDSEKPSDGTTTVEVWYPFGSDQAKALKDLVAEFERAHPKIRIHLSYASNNLTSSQKLFLAIAGGTAPDVTFVDGQQLAEWAARGALTDITDRVHSAGLSGEDFWLPRWQESTFDNRVYALPWGADPNFAMLWNKKVFREAGLDPERPPRTIAELDEYNDKITRVDAQGRIDRIGIIPWAWGGDNSMFTWAYAFGGDFYELPKADSGSMIGRVTAENPKNVEALKWMASYARRYDVRKVAAFQANFVGTANNPFFLGKMGMSLTHVTQLQYIKRYAPGLEYGAAVIPAPPDGEHPTGWIGGWSLAIPRGVKASDAAFEFMRWMCTAPEGTVAVGKTMAQFPAYRKSPYYDTIKDDPVLGVYYEIVKNAKHVRTLLPVQGYLMELLRRGVDDVIYTANEEDPTKRLDPKAVLTDISKQSQERLEQVMATVARREALAKAQEK